MSLLQNFETYLNTNLPSAKSFHPNYDEALRVMLKAGGKHFRAQLLLGTVQAFSPDLLQDAMDVALGVEFIHTYSLIHDDLPSFDNADFRRSTPTLHKTYGEVVAILVGDALNTHAFYQISKSNLSADIRIKCVEILSDNAGINGMVLGQALDCYFENKNLNIDELRFLHIHKTGKLIASSLKMGAVISNLSDDVCDTIYQIGLDLGLAFQIKDDLVDATEDYKNAGKPTLNDINKNSFTNLLGIQNAKNELNKLNSNIIKRVSCFNIEFQNMIENLINKYLKG